MSLEERCKVQKSWACYVWSIRGHFFCAYSYLFDQFDFVWSCREWGMSPLLFFVFFFYRSIVALHCCVSFWFTAVNQLCICMCHLFCSFPFRPPQSSEQSSLCSTVGSHWLSVLYLCVCSVVSDSFQPHVAHQASLPIEISRLEYWSGLLFAILGNLRDPGIKPVSSASPALAGRFFATHHLGIPIVVYMSIPISQFIPPTLSHLVSIRLFSTSVSLFLLCK